jgi:hypothetical protein
MQEYVATPYTKEDFKELKNKEKELLQILLEKEEDQNILKGEYAILSDAENQLRNQKMLDDEQAIL